MTDASNSIKNHAAFIWSVADLLRGDYKQSEYGKVILPLTVLRRFDCVLEPVKQKMLDTYARIEGKVEDSGDIGVVEVLVQVTDDIVVVGHRGVPTLHQENTLAGFRRAVELGIPAVELDVRLTADHRAVVVHDYNLARLTGTSVNVIDVISAAWPR